MGGRIEIYFEKSECGVASSVVQIVVNLKLVFSWPGNLSDVVWYQFCNVIEFKV